MTQCSAVGTLDVAAARSERPPVRRRVLKAVSVIVALAVGLVVAEGLVRIKNALVMDFDVEMWRYRAFICFQF